MKISFTRNRRSLNSIEDLPVSNPILTLTSSKWAACSILEKHVQIKTKRIDYLDTRWYKTNTEVSLFTFDSSNQIKLINLIKRFIWYFQNARQYKSKIFWSNLNQSTLCSSKQFSNFDLNLCAFQTKVIWFCVPKFLSTADLVCVHFFIF